MKYAAVVQPVGDQVKYAAAACDEALFAESVSFCAAASCSMEVCIYMSTTMYAIYMCVCMA